jgi:hypothetical protein
MKGIRRRTEESELRNKEMTTNREGARKGPNQSK